MYFSKEPFLKGHLLYLRHLGIGGGLLFARVSPNQSFDSLVRKTARKTFVLLRRIRYRLPCVCCPVGTRYMQSFA
ncbi:MAG: hypothetical protein PUC63_04710 [Clostridiales bacterium]|nr:hypothetical protein [Clostridiales bacterium]